MHKCYTCQANHLALGNGKVELLSARPPSAKQVRHTSHPWLRGCRTGMLLSPSASLLVNPVTTWVVHSWLKTQLFIHQVFSECFPCAVICQAPRGIGEALVSPLVEWVFQWGQYPVTISTLSGGIGCLMSVIDAFPTLLYNQGGLLCAAEKAVFVVLAFTARW